MRRTRKPPYALLYGWTGALTVVLLYLGEEDPVSHPFPAPPAPPPPAPPPPSCRGCFRRLMRHPPRWNSPRLLDHLRASVEPPPRAPPHPTLDPHHPPWAAVVSYNITEGYFRSIFGEKRDGVFVEVGAQDGLWLSNTWWLEAARGWRGLLVEADPLNYRDLRASPRTSPTLQACAAPSLLATKEKMVRNRSPGSGLKEAVRHQQGHTKLLKYATDSDLYIGETFTTTCYSLFSVLSAVRLRKVDLLTFDVYGGGYEAAIEFLATNKRLGKPVQAKVILYQDNELQQFFSLDDLREDFKSYGYTLIKLGYHYLLYDQSFNIVTVK